MQSRDFGKAAFKQKNTPIFIIDALITIPCCPFGINHCGFISFILPRLCNKFISFLFLGYGILLMYFRLDRQPAAVPPKKHKRRILKTME